MDNDDGHGSDTVSLPDDDNRGAANIPAAAAASDLPVPVDATDDDGKEEAAPNDGAKEGAAVNVPVKRKYGGAYCCVVGCHNSVYRDSARGIKFYRFPANNAERRDRWIQRVNRKFKDDSLWTPSGSELCNA